MGRRQIEQKGEPCPLGPYIQGLIKERPKVPLTKYAQRAGISRSYLHKLTHGETCNPHRSVIEGLATAFEVPVEEVESYSLGKQKEATVFQGQPPSSLLVELDAISSDLVSTFARLNQVRSELAQHMGIQAVQTPPAATYPIRADKI